MKTQLAYGLVILIGMAGLILCIIWTMQGKDSPLQWVIALLSMAVALIGSICLREERGQR